MTPMVVTLVIAVIVAISASAIGALMIEIQLIYGTSSSIEDLATTPPPGLKG